MAEIIKQSYAVISPNPLDGKAILKKLERVARLSHRSEHKITDDSAEKFIARIIKMGHESVLEHESITVYLVTDRAIANELTRHRLASYVQESTRYVRYNNLEFIHQGNYLDDKEMMEYYQTVETLYNRLLKHKVSPQYARAVLPLSLATRLYITANLRQWRHIFNLRVDPAAHPLIRQLLTPVLYEFKQAIPVIFDDIPIDENVLKNGAQREQI